MITMSAFNISSVRIMWDDLLSKPWELEKRDDLLSKPWVCSSKFCSVPTVEAEATC